MTSFQPVVARGDPEVGRLVATSFVFTDSAFL